MIVPLVPPTVVDFANYLQVDNDEDGISDALAIAIALVDDFLMSASKGGSQVVYTNEVLRTAHAVWKQSETVGGTNQQVIDFGQQPVRAPRDPMTASYPVLRRHFGVLPF